MVERRASMSKGRKEQKGGEAILNVPGCGEGRLQLGRGVWVLTDVSQMRNGYIEWMVGGGDSAEVKWGRG